MAYGTPIYDYEQKRSGLTQRKGLEDVGRDYGRFMSQERFRRNSADMGDRFRQGMPKVGSAFNRRGIYNSGLRQQGQNDFVKNYQQQVDRAQFDYGAEVQQDQLAQTTSDAAYRQALLDLFEQMQAQRAAGYDPFAGVR
jgi:hypothetical protein